MAHYFKKLPYCYGMLEALLFTIIFFILYSSPCYSQDKTGSFEFDGYTREYEVYLPQNFQSNMPVVFALPGLRGTISRMKNSTYLHKIADTSGFIILYTQGAKLSWNIGPGSIHSQSNYPDTDDVGFLSALIDTMYAHYEIDLARVYCCGFSLGGKMSFRLAGECGQRFAAVASVSGTLFDAAYEWPMFRPRPALQMHGTGLEYWIPYYEGTARFWPVPETIDFWLNKIGCSTQTDTVFFPDIVEWDSSQVQKITWTDCTGENEFVHYKIINGGHSWPGSAGSSPSDGNKNLDINAGKEILKFFKQFTNPSVNEAFGKSIEDVPIYISSSGKMLKFRGEIANPQQNPVKVYGMLYNTDNTCLDSVELFDDGLHDDLEASDNFLGGSIMMIPGLEDDFRMSLRTRDLQEETIHDLQISGRPYFTTKGPVKLDTMIVTAGNENPIPPERIKFSLALINEGNTADVFDIDVNIIMSDNQFITNTTTGIPKFGDIGPGESLTNSSRDFALSFNDGCEPGAYEFGLEITSYDLPVWYDTLTIVVAEPTGVEDDQSDLPTEFSLGQNYPNPFNPSTTIKYSLPVISWQSSVGSQKQKISQSTNHSINQSNGGLVSLKIYDVLGKEVATLVNEQQRPGRYEVKWNAAGITSGVYFYKFTAGSFAETKKMLLLR